MSHDAVIAAFSEEHAARLSGVSRAQLRHWDRTGLLKPSYAEPDRRGAFSRVYSFADLVSLLHPLRVVPDFTHAKTRSVNPDPWALAGHRPSDPATAFAPSRLRVNHCPPSSWCRDRTASPPAPCRSRFDRSANRAGMCRHRGHVHEMRCIGVEIRFFSFVDKISIDKLKLS
jgi:hypothetical protein